MRSSYWLNGVRTDRWGGEDIVTMCGKRFRELSGTISEAIVKVEDHLGEDKSLKKTVSLMRMKLVEGRKRKYQISDA